MKKIALCSVLCCLYGMYVFPSFADSCEIRKLTAMEDEEGDEYLYVSAGHARSEDAFVCEKGGNEKNCSDGSFVAIRGEHWIGDKPQGSSVSVYKCRTTGWYGPSNDKWNNVGTTSLQPCDKSKIKTQYVEFSKMDSRNVIYCKKDKFFNPGTQAWCTGVQSDDICVSDECDDCNKKEETVKQCGDYSVGALMESVNCSQTPSGAEYSDLKTGETCKKMCLEEIASGDVKQVWSISKCPPDKMDGVALSNPEKYRPAATGYKKCVAKANNGGGNTNNTCDKYKSYPERYACCKAGNATGWFVTGSTTQKSTNPASGECKCVDASGNVNDAQEWVYDSSAKTGQCRAKTVSDSTPPATEQPCYITFSMDINCANGNSYKAGTRYPVPQDKVSQFGNCGGAQNQLNSLGAWIAQNKTEITQYQELINMVCGYQGLRTTPAAPTGPTDEQISSAKTRLNTFFANATANKSVWKDAEGNFNTARLASDLTAGVVLGTVGGVVSGVVIKKKQVEKGFEALHCTVGGQTVADWGDEFTVGLKR